MKREGRGEEGGRRDGKEWSVEIGEGRGAPPISCTGEVETPQ